MTGTKLYFQLHLIKLFENLEYLIFFFFFFFFLDKTDLFTLYSDVQILLPTHCSC